MNSIKTPPPNETDQPGTSVDQSQRSLTASLVPLLLGFLLSMLMLGWIANQPEEDVTEFALGTGNGVPDRKIDGSLIHFREKPDFESDVDNCGQQWKASRIENAVLWLGNSQLHAINQMQDGEESATLSLHRRLKPKGKYLVAGSLNNANLQEHYVVFEYVLPRLNIKTFLLPVVFDDMRETGVRSEIDIAFRDSDAMESLGKTELGARLLASAKQQDSAGNDMAALEATVQQRVEETLDASLSNQWKVWEERPSLRSRLFVKLYQLRNFALGIDPTSKRRMIPARYNDNRQAFSLMLEHAAKSGIEVIPYIVPLRSDVPIPYDAKQYQAFKEDMTKVAKQHGFKMRNFEDVVPGKFWGTKDATSIGGEQELDFMHFQVGGHRLMAAAMEKEIEQLEAGQNR